MDKHHAKNIGYAIIIALYSVLCSACDAGKAEDDPDPEESPIEASSQIELLIRAILNGNEQLAAIASFRESYALNLDYFADDDNAIFHICDRPTPDAQGDTIELTLGDEFTGIETVCAGPSFSTVAQHFPTRWWKW